MIGSSRVPRFADFVRALNPQKAAVIRYFQARMSLDSSRRMLLEEPQARPCVFFPNWNPRQSLSRTRIRVPETPPFEPSECSGGVLVLANATGRLLPTLSELGRLHFLN